MKSLDKQKVKTFEQDAENDLVFIGLCSETLRIADYSIPDVNWHKGKVLKSLFSIFSGEYYRAAELKQLKIILMD